MRFKTNCLKIFSFFLMILILSISFNPVEAIKFNKIGGFLEEYELHSPYYSDFSNKDLDFSSKLNELYSNHIKDKSFYFNFDYESISYSFNIFTCGNRPKMIYVDDDNIEGPWNGTIEYPYNSITKAIGNLSSGDTIFVYNGSYMENIIIKEGDFNGNIKFHLIGENKYDTVIDGYVDMWSPNISVDISCFTIKNGVIFDMAYNNSLFDNIIYDGIYIINSLNNTIKENILNSTSLFMGSTFYNNIINNTFLNSYILNTDYAGYNIIINNTFDSGGICLRSEKDDIFWDTLTIENNTLNDRPIRYYKDIEGVTVPEDTAQLILADCNNFTIQNLNITNTKMGITLGFSYNCTIKNCKINTSTFKENEQTTPIVYVPSGIYLYESKFNIIIDCKLFNNRYGIFCLNNLAINPGRPNWTIPPIYDNNTINNNKIWNNEVGILVFNQMFCNITNNYLYNNGLGMRIGIVYKPLIKSNIISQNQKALMIHDNSFAKIIKNNITKNYDGIFLFFDQFPKIKNNNFIDNTNSSAYFEGVLFKIIYSGRWVKNYWDRPRILPKKINGKFYFPPIPLEKNLKIPKITFDWNPTLKPNIIT